MNVLSVVWFGVAISGTVGALIALAVPRVLMYAPTNDGTLYIDGTLNIDGASWQRALTMAGPRM